MNYLELLKLALPETIIAITALLVLAVDLVALREIEVRFRFIIGGMIACVGCVGAIVWMLISHTHANAFGGMLVVDPLTQFVKIALLVLTIFTICCRWSQTLPPTQANILRSFCSQLWE